MNKRDVNAIVKNINSWTDRELNYYLTDENDLEKYTKWNSAKKIFNDFILDYIKSKYYENDNWDFQFKIFHDRINSLKVTKDNYYAVLVLFTSWNHIKSYLSEDTERFQLCDASKYLYDITKKDKDIIKLKKQLEKLNKSKDKKYCNRYLKYRDIIGILNNFCEVDIIDQNEVHSFPLEWDWWFNIDDYLDMCSGWNTNIDN